MNVNFSESRVFAWFDKFTILFSLFASPLRDSPRGVQASVPNRLCTSASFPLPDFFRGEEANVHRLTQPGDERE